MSHPEISSGGKSSSLGYLSKLDASADERIWKQPFPVKRLQVQDFLASHGRIRT